MYNASKSMAVLCSVGFLKKLTKNIDEWTNFCQVRQCFLLSQFYGIKYSTTVFNDEIAFHAQKLMDCITTYL